MFNVVARHEHQQERAHSHFITTRPIGFTELEQLEVLLLGSDVVIEGKTLSVDKLFRQWVPHPVGGQLQWVLELVLFTTEENS